MDKALLVNIILASLTFVYVTLTYFLLRNTIHQNKVFIEQLRINTIPLFDCEVPINSKSHKPEIIIRNIGQVPAFDIDIYISGILNDDIIPRNKLIEKYVIKKVKNNKIIIGRINLDEVELIGDGQYGIYERGVYPTLPPKRLIDYATDYKIAINQFEILIQFRDYLGNNYAQLYWFFQDDDKTCFKFGLMEPNVPKITPRLDLNDIKNSKLIPDNFKTFVDRLNISIPANYLKKMDHFLVENRWPIK